MEWVGEKVMTRRLADLPDMGKYRSSHLVSLQYIQQTCAVSTVPVPGALFMIEFIILYRFLRNWIVKAQMALAKAQTSIIFN